MKKTAKVVAIIIVIIGVIAGVAFLLQGLNFDVLNPQGEVAHHERNILLFTLALSLIVVIPVFTLLVVFSLRYREGNKKKAVYRPDWDDNALLETIWWGIPCAIILVLGIVTWQTSHSLDPYRPLDSAVKPLNVQVVALQWKWLFIYPDEGVASVNLLQIPEKTPINFEITSDAPMNSFWIPSLGGQIYAMSGMSTKLHLIADRTGDYKGSSANISGTGFADMNFIARASSVEDFNAWVKNIKTNPTVLDLDSYNELAKPSVMKEPIFYSLSHKDLYDYIIVKYMMPIESIKGPNQKINHSVNFDGSNYDSIDNSRVGTSTMEGM